MTLTRSKYQNGHLFKSHGSWFVRFRQQVREGEEVRTIQTAQRLASVSDYPRKAEILPLKNEFMARLNRSGFTPEQGVTVVEFVENVYLPATSKRLEKSTYHTNAALWEHYLKPRMGNIRVRDFRTVDGENLMQDIERERGQEQLSHMTYARIKVVLSAIFTHAKRMGVIDGANPITGVSTPKGKAFGRKRHAYSLEQIQRIIAVLPDPLRAAVAIAAFAGLREGEIRGLQWADYHATELHIRRSVWNTHIKANTKTGENDEHPGVVPVIPTLRRILDEYQATWQQRNLGQGTDFLFTNSKGAPEWLGHRGYFTIKHILAPLGIPWLGWHAFRRGLATNLNSLGVDDTTIQAILRHASVRTTQSSYIQPVRQDVAAAMAKLEETWQKNEKGLVN